MTDRPRITAARPADGLSRLEPRVGEAREDMRVSRDIAAGSAIGPYILEERLGGGGFGAVWRATDTRTAATVALKLLIGAHAGNRAAVRAQVELLAASASSRSPHVVRVLDGGVDPVPCVVMEYIDGEDLARVLETRGPLSAQETIEIGQAIAEALAALGEAGIIHRDVKPANVLIDRRGVPRLADFGIAKVVGMETITMTGQLPLTMAYAAPEVWEGTVTPQSDLYSLGVVLYQCLTASLPFTGNYGALYRAHKTQPPDLDRLPDDAPPSLRRVVRACLEKSSEHRPSDAAACKALLDQARAELTAPPAPEPKQFGPWKRRGPHPTLPDAWRSIDEETGAVATVEVISTEDPTVADDLRHAVGVSARLAPLGAERLIGCGELRTDDAEAWITRRTGRFHLWVARDELGELPPPGEVSVPRLRRAVESLQALPREAAAVGLPVALDAMHLQLLPDGSVHVRRPGIAPAGDDPEADALAVLRALPLDEDAWALCNEARSLDDLQATLGGSGRIGVARSDAPASPQLAPAAAGVADAAFAGDGPTMFVAAPVGAGRGRGRRPPAPPEDAPLPGWPHFYIAAAVIAAAAIAVLAYIGVMVALDHRGGPPSSEAADVTATPGVGTPSPENPSEPTPSDEAQRWIVCATAIATGELRLECTEDQPQATATPGAGVIGPGDAPPPTASKPGGAVGGFESTPSATPARPPVFPPSTPPPPATPIPSPTTIPPTPLRPTPVPPTPLPPTPIPPTAVPPTPVPPPVIVDDLDAGFTRGGPNYQCGSQGVESRSYTWCWDTRAYNGAAPYAGHYWYTWNNGKTSADINWGQWTATLPFAGPYRVCAYIPPNHAYTKSARYRVSHAQGESTVVVNQQPIAGWTDLGACTFNAGVASVYLGDITGEADATTLIGYDAMKWVPNGGGC